MWAHFGPPPRLLWVECGQLALPRIAMLDKSCWQDGFRAQLLFGVSWWREVLARSGVPIELALMARAANWLCAYITQLSRWYAIITLLTLYPIVGQLVLASTVLRLPDTHRDCIMIDQLRFTSGWSRGINRLQSKQWLHYAGVTQDQALPKCVVTAIRIGILKLAGALTYISSITK